MTKKLSLLFALMLSTLTSSAYDAQIDGIYYNFDTSAKTATVTSGDTKYTGSVTIPETVTYNDVSCSVTSIGNRAFFYCRNLTSVTIPNSVTLIGNEAFPGCSSLTSVRIPNSVTSIGRDAFYYCKALTSVTIGNSVTSIGNNAFAGCSSLTSVTIPNSVTFIGTNAFNDCSGLTSVTIPNSITSIGNYTFSNCSSLASIEIPNSVTSIGYCAFSNCSGLTSVTIGNSVTSIGGNAFYGCYGLTSISVESGNPEYDSRDNCNAIIETATNNLIMGCGNTVIPNGVKSIGSSAFSGHTDLTSVTIPNSVTSIGDNAFRDCIGLTSITCEATSVPSTGSDVFNNVPATLYVPASALEAYKATEPWSDFGNIVVIGDEPVIEIIAINETNFPDENFRNWVLSQFYGKDGVLTDAEIACVKNMNLYPPEYNIQNMQGLEFFTALRSIDISGGNLTSLDVSKNTKLESLYCYGNMFTSLDLSQNKALISLNCFGNLLTSLDLSNNTALKSLVCKYNQLTSLDVSKCTALQMLECEYNQLTSLDVSNKTALYWLSCNNNQLTSLDVSGCPNLSILSIYCNQLKGVAMNKLVEDLPTFDFENHVGVLYFENEGNVMTTTQVAAAKAKYWFPYYAVSENDWREYVGSEPDFLRGDVNGDGEVNVGDLVSVSNFMAGDVLVSKDAADVNQDGEVNVGDMVVISNIMSGNE